MSTVGLTAFAREMIEFAFEGGDLDGSIQEMAVKHGLLEETRFDPEKHKDHLNGYAQAGDPWFVFAGPLTTPAPSDHVDPSAKGYPLAECAPTLLPTEPHEEPRPLGSGRTATLAFPQTACSPEVREIDIERGQHVREGFSDACMLSNISLEQGLSEDTDMSTSPPTPSKDLRVTNPATIAQFVGALSEHGVKLPLQITEEDVGTLVDVDGKPVLVVDVDRERSDEDVAWIVGMIEVAVNTCGGFIAQRAATTTEAQS